MKKPPKYEYHDIANVFPLMTEAELDELAKDIKANGLTCPIVLYDDKILDGRNRYLACQKAGVTPKFWEYPGDTPIQFVLSLNLHRRHLTISQRAAIAAELATLPQGARTDLASNESRFSQAQAADALNVSRSSLLRARQVQEADPELHRQVRDGEISVEDARRAIRRSRSPRSRKRKKTETPKRTLAECEQVISNGLQKLQDQFPELPMEDIIDLMSNRSQCSPLSNSDDTATESNDAVELPSPDQCDSSHRDTDKPDTITEFEEFVKRLSEQRHETEWQIKSSIYGMLYSLNMTEGPYIPGQRWEPIPGQRWEP